MIIPYSTTLDHSSSSLSSGVSTVECHKQVWSWRLLHSLLELLIGGCSWPSLAQENDFKHKKIPHYFSHHDAIVTGTIFGFRHGKVRFCIQTNPKSTTPILLLELSLPTKTLAKEMRGGFLRIAFRCTKNEMSGNIGTINSSSCDSTLLSVPVWTMLCNGRKAGFAVKRNPSKFDIEISQQLISVGVGAGTVRAEELKCEDDAMYLRGKFQRVHRSSNSESFHLIDIDNDGQELSFFFLRS